MTSTLSCSLGIISVDIFSFVASTLIQHLVIFNEKPLHKMSQKSYLNKVHTRKHILLVNLFHVQTNNNSTFLRFSFEEPTKIKFSKQAMKLSKRGYMRCIHETESLNEQWMLRKIWQVSRNKGLPEANIFPLSYLYHRWYPILAL